ncbi:helicase-related protein [Salipiger sp. 1_MG-2023]|uniref:helicase-related protein n=1 Tax=Salipiger sp. 1_MG-2023 TaxID=3062665 RepID=UPI0026E2203E|nr:helicase-related protein [Salipiger sp. 1_MG-2023]MDO6585765.1 helicase-related protein [Salipiger sp. 1_MG-2023]
MPQRARIAAVLGPTNTGKTHYAIERMLGHRTGMIGLPLRLLAREVYDKIVAARGPGVVALVTGEERIVPPRAAYWVCTVEAMPEGMGTDFVGIDEIQLCADPERGHVFTDRLLRMRGLHETLFMGADTMRGPISQLVKGVEFIRRERMSQLSYLGSKKISRMPARSAIVGFSVDNVYAIAELIRRTKGGAAVVMGALSPRTRNAQVDLYQNGEVDYLVATDAIGMGLNLDIDHVAFSSLTKFDGRRMRELQPNELAQIAGRAGRGMKPGTFGTTGDAGQIPDDWVEAITSHSFTPIRKLGWRNSDLRFGSIDALVQSLEMSPDNEWLMKAREADDLQVLKSLSREAEVFARASNPASVQLLWDVCRVPDFRGISHAEHAGLLQVIFQHLHERGSIPADFFARQVKRIDRTDGDIDALSKRLAYIRTWTYVAQRKGWVDDEMHWRDATRAVEDALSDALHERLTQRFVDRRTSVLLRRLKQKEALLADVNDKGEVTVEGEFVGRLEGFRFRQDQGATGQEAKTLKQASLQALAPHFHLRADRFYNAPDTEIDFTEQGGLMWGDQAVGRLAKGDDALKPRIVAFVDDTAGADVVQKVERRLQHFIDRKIAALFEPLLNLRDDEALTGLARGFAFRMVESMGIVPRAQVADEVKQLDQDSRGALRKHGIRFGQYTIFMPLLLKPAPTRLRLVLWSLFNDLDHFPEAPPPGLVTVPNIRDVPMQHYTLAGYRPSGERAIRIDMLERLADLLRAQDSRGGFEANPDMLSITGMTLEQFSDLMGGLGYKAEKAERSKVRAADTVVTTSATPEGESGEDIPVFDAAQIEETSPGAAPDMAQTPAAADVVAGTESIDDAGYAPINEDPEPVKDDDNIAETPEEELLPGTAPDEALSGPEIEVFYTFTWGGNRGARGGNRREQGGARSGAPRGKGKPQGERQAGERQGGERGDRGAQGKGPRKGKGGKPQGGPGNKSKTYESGPRKADRIDPDNPFAAALMGFKNKS